MNIPKGVTLLYQSEFGSSSDVSALPTRQNGSPEMKIEAVIAPKTESKLEFADGSKRYLLATQREGKTLRHWATGRYNDVGVGCT